jgi:hypothetical protein
VCVCVLLFSYKCASVYVSMHVCEKGVVFQSCECDARAARPLELSSSEAPPVRSNTSLAEALTSFSCTFGFSRHSKSRRLQCACVYVCMFVIESGELTEKCFLSSSDQDK